MSLALPGCCQKANAPDDPELQRLKSFSELTPAPLALPGCCQKAESPDDPELQRLKSFSRWVAYLKTQKDRLQKDPGECVRLLTMHSSKHTKAHTSHPQASPSEISPSSFPFFLFPKLPDPGYLSFSTIFLTICMKPWPLASWIQTEFKGASKIAPA
eukprot:1151371-Pelagomonas_calceolata.AAC.1